MTANLRICVPDATENYIQNPALRYDTTGWNAFGSTITRSMDQARFGIASLKVVTNGSVLREGAYYRVNTLAGISEPITVSIYVRGTGRVHIRLIDNPSGKEWVSDACILRLDRWQRISTSGFSTGSSDMRLYVEADGNTPAAITFYADGAQMERKAYATSYCDGDQEGCRWNIINHGSNSTRDANTRAGGKWVPLAGPCRWNDDIYVTVVGGLGMPPLTNNTQSWALAPGSFYQSTKILDRVVTLSFNVKKVNKRLSGKPNLSPLHKLRQELIDVIKPDLTLGGEAFWFSYQEGDRELFIRLRYEAGLEGEWDIRNPYYNSFPIRFVANDPVFQEDTQDAQQLSYKTVMNSFYGAGWRNNGKWQMMGAGLNAGLTGYVRGAKGEIYAYGAFTKTADSKINLGYIGKWDGTQWNSMAGGANQGISDVAIAPNGNVYAVGTFTSIGGVAANHVAYWDGAAWHALGSGLNNNTFTIAIDSNGVVYVGGQFTQAGGINAYYAAYFDGAWHQMGSYRGLNGQVNSIVINNANLVYIGGSFYQEYGNINNLYRICSYNKTTNLFSAVGLSNGFNNDINCLVFSSDGTLYAGGAFTFYSSTSVNYVAKWNGTAWVPLGNGMNAAVSNLSAGNYILASGNFTTADGNPTVLMALWNGSAWVNMDLIRNDPGSYCMAGLITPNGDIYIDGGFTPTAASINLIQNNGTEEAYPIFYILGQGTLYWIENQTNQKRMYFNLAINANEEVFIDPAQGKITSTVRGDLSYGLLSASDFKDFTLLPGQNEVACLMSNDVNASMQIRWKPMHWSADATATPESLTV